MDVKKEKRIVFVFVDANWVIIDIIVITFGLVWVIHSFITIGLRTVLFMSTIFTWFPL